MTIQTASAAIFNSFILDSAIVIDGQVLHAEGAEIKVRTPNSGELRNLQVAALLQMDYNQVETLAPRVTQPVLHKQAVAAMCPGDFTQLASEIAGFLLPKGAKASSPQA